MGIVWETYHKGVPILGVPGITLDSSTDAVCLLEGVGLQQRRVKRRTVTTFPKARLIRVLLGSERVLFQAC